jgi:hypothetical protein
MITDDFFSVEIMQSNNAVAFVPKTREVFREDGQVVESVTPDGVSYVAWGDDDYMPYEIIDMIESDETLSTCQVFNAEVCYGAGLRYNTDAIHDKLLLSSINDFLLDNPLPDFFLGACQDMKHFAFAVSVIVLSKDAKRIVGLYRKPACYCRFARVDATGKIPYIVFGNFRDKLADGQFEKIPLLDIRSPYRDLVDRMEAGRPDRKFAIVTKFPAVDSTYYPIPHYASLFRGNWYQIKKLIAMRKKAKLDNAVPIKYVIEISPSYWDNLFAVEKVSEPHRQRELVNKRKQEIMNFLTASENTGSVLFTGKSLSIDGSRENPDISVVAVDSKNKEGGDWESDIAEAINMICFTMRVHSNLVGSVPGNSSVNNSGSDKRELYTIAQALQKPYHDVMFNIHNLIIKYNNWTGVYPECPFIQLTTLDEHRDAKEVGLE